MKMRKVLITGQGRGGTSAIASIFYHLGYYMPNGDTYATFEDEKLRQHLASGEVEEVIQELNFRVSQHDLVAWKDPKLFGINGRELSGKISNDWLYVFVFRDPYAITLRKSMSGDSVVDRELLNASKYNRKLVEFYLSVKERNPCYIISYEKLLTDKLNVIGSLCDFLGFPDAMELAESLALKVGGSHTNYLAMGRESERKFDAMFYAKRVFDIEISEMKRVQGQIGVGFAKAIELARECKGRIAVIGMGKSGIIGRKIVATLVSTGTGAFFVHPAEAYHGDLGMIHAEDVALMISNSGETEELIRLLPFMKHQSNKVIAMTGNLESTLAKNSDVVLDVSVGREACEHNLAPTSSTTATLVMGDAFAVVLSTLKDFQPEDFARFHPGGSLGRRLLTKVSDVMHKHDLPICAPNAALRDVVSVITRGKLGVALVMDSVRMLGIITDGDLRKAFETSEDPLKLCAREFMTEHPYTIRADHHLFEAERIMKALTKRVMVVVNNQEEPVGVLQIFDVDE
jgi:arabinose-5-phosphate isomerase